MSCTAPPGWFCSPLDNSAVICPANWYCPGGNYPARACPDHTWSSVGSAYIDSCQDNMNLALAVTIVLIIVLFAIFICTWDSYYFSGRIKRHEYIVPYNSYSTELRPLMRDQPSHDCYGNGVYPPPV